MVCAAEADEVRTRAKNNFTAPIKLLLNLYWGVGHILALARDAAVCLKKYFPCAALLFWQSWKDDTTPVVNPQVCFQRLFDVLIVFYKKYLGVY
jgi:hypothetical protein